MPGSAASQVMNDEVYVVYTRVTGTGAIFIHFVTPNESAAEQYVRDHNGAEYMGVTVSAKVEFRA